MNKTRLEALSDGVIAIIITVMLLHIKIPQGENFQALAQEATIFFSYLFSFIYVGIYWNNHHHLFRLVDDVNGVILWSNLYLIFWLTMIPIATAWMGVTDYASIPTASYAFVLFMCSGAYWLLKHNIIKHEGNSSKIATVLHHDKKALISVVLYATAIGMSFIHTGLTVLFLVILAAFWFYPDKRIESYLQHKSNKENDIKN